MAQNDLDLFIQKVDQLNNLIQSLDEFPERRRLLSNCSSHNEVIELAQSWGYQIGRRWGEPPTRFANSKNDNLLQKGLPDSHQEVKHLIHKTDTWDLRLVISCSESKEECFWKSDKIHKWILVLRGSVTCDFKVPELSRDMSIGDHVYIPAKKAYKIARIDPYPGSAWLELLWVNEGSIKP